MSMTETSLTLFVYSLPPGIYKDREKPPSAFSAPHWTLGLSSYVRCANPLIILVALGWTHSSMSCCFCAGQPRPETVLDLKLNSLLEKFFSKLKKNKIQKKSKHDSSILAILLSGGLNTYQQNNYFSFSQELGWYFECYRLRIYCCYVCLQT